MKRILWILLLCGFPLLQAELTTSVKLQKLSRINMRSLDGDVEEDWPHESYGEFLERARRYQEEEFNPLKKRNCAFQVLKKAIIDSPYRLQTISDFSVLPDVITWSDLQLFTGKEPGQPYLGSIINRTETEVGYAFFLQTLANPSSTPHEIIRRQSIVFDLVSDKPLLRDVHACLKELKKHEPAMLSLFMKADPLYNTAIKQHYVKTPYEYINHKLNSNDSSLLVYSILGHEKRMLQVLCEAAASVVIPVYIASELTHLMLPNQIKNFALRLAGIAGANNVLVSFVNNKYIALGAMAVAATYCFSSTKKSLAWSRDNFFLDWCLQKKLQSVRAYFAAAQRLANLLKDQELVSNLELYREFKETLAKHTGSRAACSLKKLLATSTFKGEPSYISNHGRILCAYKNLHDCKEEFVPLMAAVAEVDAYCSAALLYTEFQNKPVKFCFVGIATGQTPIMSFDDLWNPFIDAQSAIVNTVSMYPKNPHTMVLTGPNAAGKSTFVKAVAQALVLAQSFGIAPARAATITPFAQIVTYLNITDDINLGNSLFKSQVLRMQYIVDQATTLQAQGKNIFIAIDEMFNGTSTYEAMACAYSVAWYLGLLKNTVTIIATHYGELATLAHQFPSFANYKVSVNFTPQGRIQYPFVITPGVSDQHVAIDILEQEGLAGSIIEQAKKIMHLHEGVRT